MRELAKLILGFGVVLVILGGILLLAGSPSGRVPWLGRLPGDISIEREHWRLYLPLGSSVLLSIVASIVLALLLAAFGRR